MAVRKGDGPVYDTEEDLSLWLFLILWSSLLLLQEVTIHWKPVWIFTIEQRALHPGMLTPQVITWISILVVLRPNRLKVASMDQHTTIHAEEAVSGC